MNLSILTPDEKLAAVAKPKLGIIDKLEITSDDLLVVCAGFEDRALAMLQSSLGRGVRFTVLLIHYDPFFQENKADLIRKTCAAEGLDVLEITYNRKEPVGFGDQFVEKLGGCRGVVFLDVSAMSRILIVQLLVALGTREGGFDKCSVVYAEAREYPPTEAEAAAKFEECRCNPTSSILFLSSGVFDVTIIPELSSVASAASQTRLILFPSLDAHHLTALRNEIQPSRFTFVEGVPPDARNKWRQAMISDANGLSQIQDSTRCLTSTLNYEETLQCLLEIYAKHSGQERLLVAPTGSKMQTVAVGIFRAFVQDVQIVYPTPQGFLKPDGYTLGVGQLHLLPLTPFSRVIVSNISQ